MCLAGDSPAASRAIVRCLTTDIPNVMAMVEMVKTYGIAGKM